MTTVRSTRSWPVPPPATARCGAVGTSPAAQAHAIANNIQAKLRDMPGFIGVRVETTGFAPFVRVDFDGPASWRGSKMAELAGLRPRPAHLGGGYVDPNRGNISVGVVQMNLGTQTLGETQNRFVAEARNAPAFRQALEVLRSARYTDHRTEAAQALLRGDQLLQELALAEGINPNLRLPRAPSGFQSCFGR